MTFFLKVINKYVKYNTIQWNIHEDTYKEIIFTKILTKYSNEYSNSNFIIYLCNKLNIQNHELYNLISKNEQTELMDKFKDCVNNVEEKRIIKLINN